MLASASLEADMTYLMSPQILEYPQTRMKRLKKVNLAIFYEGMLAVSKWICLK